MSHEIKDGARARSLFADAPERYVHLLDLLDRDPAELSIRVDDPDRPANLLAVHWQGGPLGLSSLVEIRARRLRGLGELIGGLPRAEGRYELVCPFWAAPLLEETFRTEVQGPISRYLLRPGDLRLPPAAGRTEPFGGEDLEFMAFAFPRRVPDAPHRALVLREELAAVAVTTALAEGVARIGVHVVEALRGHGFGAAVAGALAQDLLAAGLRPTAEVWLAGEPAVRLVESLGMVQVDTLMRVVAVGRVAEG